jgi:hypothetical protein
VIRKHEKTKDDLYWNAKGLLHLIEHNDAEALEILSNQVGWFRLRCLDVDSGLVYSNASADEYDGALTFRFHPYSFESAFIERTCLVGDSFKSYFENLIAGAPSDNPGDYEVWMDQIETSINMFEFKMGFIRHLGPKSRFVFSHYELMRVVLTRLLELPAAVFWDVCTDDLGNRSQGKNNNTHLLSPESISNVETWLNGNHEILEQTVFDASLSLAMGGKLTTIPDAVSTFLRNVNAVTNPTMHPVSAAEAMMRARYVDTFAHPDVIRVSGFDGASPCGDLGESG